MALRRKPARGNKAQQRKELDDLHRVVVMMRHKAYAVPTQAGKYGWMGRCLKCGKERWLQVSHIAPKGQYPGSRHDPDNAFALCYYCHIHWWHKNPEAARAFGIQQLGQDKWDALWLRARAGKYLTGLELTRQFLYREAWKLTDPTTLFALLGKSTEGTNDGA